MIPRLQLVELEDQAWFPTTIRDLATDYLHFIEERLHLERAVAPFLLEALRAGPTSRVVDLCSGGGGPVPALQRELAGEGLRVEFTLTDRFPNASAFEAALCSADPPGSIRFVAEPVDARAVPPELDGCRTLFNAFHHFRPSDATAILRDAVTERQPLLLFEVSDRRLANVLSIPLVTPLLVLISALLIRPFRWRRLLFCTLLPAVPFVCTWDGVVSQLRAYTVAELQAMADAAAHGTGYQWRAGHTPTGIGLGRLTYLIGKPA